MSENPQFQFHVRQLLRDYSLTHYTTNYLRFTSDVVFEFLDQLHLAPTSDPTSLTVPTDPFVTFLKTNSIDSLPPHDEIWQTTTEAVNLIKQCQRQKPGPSKSETVSGDDDHDGPAVLMRPFSPVLTRRAVRQTPRPGQIAQLRTIPSTYSSLCSTHQLLPLDVEPVEEPIVSLEHVLDVTIKLDKDEQDAVRPLLEATMNMLKPSKNPSGTQSHIDILNQRDWPEIPAFEPYFVPMFPRKDRPQCGSQSSTSKPIKPHTLADLAMAVMPMADMEEPEIDLPQENMLIIDGWQTLRSSPISESEASLSDQEIEVDQLHLPSTPPTDPPLIEELFKSKIDVVEMPRSRRVGGRSGVGDHILKGKTLGSFLTPLLPKLVHSEDLTIAEERNCSPKASTSVLGQPASTDQLEDTNIPCDPNNDLDTEIKQLYKYESPNQIILEEKIDDKGALQLMDVPSLPPPNVHPRSMFIPMNLADLTSAANNEAFPLLAPPGLKKVGLRKSLSVALSWVPFTVDKKLPTITEIVGVDSIGDELDHPGGPALDSEIEALLAKCAILGDDCDYNEKDYRSDNFPGEELQPVCYPSGGFQIMSNRKERQRLANCIDLQDQRHDIIECDEDQEFEVDELEDIHWPRKRARLVHHSDSSEDMELRPHIGTIYEDARTDQALCFSDDEKENRDPLVTISALTDQRLYASPGCHSMDVDLLPNERENNDECRNSPVYLEGSNNGQLSQTFDPLLFDSQQLRSTGASQEQQRLVQTHNNAPHCTEMRLDSAAVEDIAIEPPLPLPVDLSSAEQIHNINARSSFLAEVNAFNHSHGLLGFARLRAINLPEITSVSTEPVAVDSSSAPLAAGPIDKSAPQDIFDRNTIRLPEEASLPVDIHRYMVSLDVIQKQTLIRCLRSSQNSVELIERDSLDGAHLILDPYTAIIFIPLLTLPSECAAYVERISAQSWKYSQLNIIFEAYPESCSFRPQNRESELYAYTPPILKSIKKLRRDVDIAEACGSKSSHAKVNYAFADTVEDAARLVRCMGDIAQDADRTQGAVWGEREWLGEASEDEADLASVNGMNRFSASIILCQMSLDEFLDTTPEGRIDHFGQYIGSNAVVAFNEELESRYRAIESGNSQPGSDIPSSEVPS